MQKWFRYIAVIFLLIYGIQFVQASHIVGGVMNYKYLGNDNFEINLYVYRDCKRANPGATLDPEARIWVYDNDIDSLYNIYLFPIPFDSFLDASIKDPCALIQPDECVDWTRYQNIINLPPNGSGYEIYYQRCCRNNSVLNITSDSIWGQITWGATYTINIPPAETGQHIINTSPVFSNYPPVYICLGKPIDYDHSAYDADGDSLVYKLCTPYSGASIFDPLNDYTYEPPPFDTIEWRPPFSLSNVLGGTPLSINSNTGHLSGTPTTQGQFVVGVSIEEYRNGNLLTKTIRDFQFNVVNCGLQVISSFFAPELQCNSLDVHFNNQSVGADSYLWDFGDGQISTEENPIHTYADTGVYSVKLICTKGDTCHADFIKEVSVQYKRIKADFTLEDTTCLQQGNLLQFIDHSTDSLSVIAWKWAFSNGDSSTVQYPKIRFDSSLNFISATLIVTSKNGCSDTITKQFNLLKQPTYSLSPILTKCTNQNVQLDLEGNGNSSYLWIPSDYLDNPTIKNPTSSTSENITYHVLIKSVLSNGDTCVQEDSVQIIQLQDLQLNTQDTIQVCRDSVRLSVPISAGQTVIWSTSSTFNPIIGTTTNLAVLQINKQQKYYVKISASGFCEKIDSIVVLFSDTIPQIALTDVVLQCSNQFNFIANINYYDNIVWSNNSTFSPILSNSTQLSVTQIPKTSTYYIKADYQTCSNIDSIMAIVQDTIPQIFLEDTIQVCRELTRINAVIKNFTSIQWSETPIFTSIIGTTPRIVVAQLVPLKTYYIRAFYRDCEVTDSVVVMYNDTVPRIQLSDSISLCTNQINIVADVSNADQIKWSVYPDFQFILATGNQLNFIQQKEIQTYYIEAIHQFCSVVDSIQIRIPKEIPSIQLIDSLFVCADSARIMANVQNYDSLQWSINTDFTTILDTTSSFTIAQTETEKTYYLKVFKNNCAWIDSIKVFYNPTVPTVSLSSPTNFCTDSVFAYAFVLNYDDIEWYDSRDLSHLIGTNLTLQITQQQGEKWYYIKADNKFCSTIDSILLKNNSIKYQKQDIEVCLGDSAKIDLEIQTSSDYIITWHYKNDTIKINNSSTLSLKPDSSFYVYFNIQNNFGCTQSDSVLINVYPKPEVQASTDKPIVYYGETAQLLATENQNYAYHWLPENAVSNPSIFNPTTTPLENTTYTILITDNHQCRNQDTVSIQVVQYECGSKNIFLPTAFSPNGDEINDVYFVRSSVLKSMLLVIYDRWGNKVFESKDINIGWDGTYKGKPANADVYGYYFTGECLQGEKISLKGNITLLR
ncbi:MAG: gliding motility-associated C-terminal domain-containing protein [Bacteroidetes bacterium]|nr:gliding motility-associated C-terminal domain-containing protein [Bacteroidota bacterium]